MTGHIAVVPLTVMVGFNMRTGLGRGCLSAAWVSAHGRGTPTRVAGGGGRSQRCQRQRHRTQSMLESANGHASR